MKKSTILSLFYVICLVFALVVSGSNVGIGAPLIDYDYATGADDAEISFADGVPIPPNVRPVIIVSGTDYEIGYQWFQQHVHIWGPWILKEIQQELTEEQITALQAWQVSLKKYAPEFIDIMRGMAQGATDAGVPLTYAQVIAHFCKPEKLAGVPPGAEEEKLAEECSGFAAWGSATKDGKLVCGGTGDSSLIKFEHVVMVFPKDGGNNFIISPYGTEDRKPGRAWQPLHPGMNNKGLAYIHHGGGNFGNEPGYDMVYGLPRSINDMHALRFANNAKEALEMMLANPTYTKGNWVDISGDNWVLECRDPQAIRRPGDGGERDFIYSTNNCLSPILEKFMPKHKTIATTYVPHAGWFCRGSASSISRNLMMWNMLHNYHGQIDVDFAKMMMRYPGEPAAYPTLEEANAAYGPTLGEGWNSPIGELNNEMVGIMVPDNGNNGLFWASSFRVGKVAHPQGPTGHYYPVAPTFTFYQLKLDSDPVKVVKAAMDRAQYDLHYANKELRKLTYWDPPYAPLDALFNQAATEWVKAKHYQRLALRTKGNDSINNYGKALRAYTRCQAYANQVYESLVPPPDDPTDLGLGELYGPWGEWTKRP